MWHVWWRGEVQAGVVEKPEGKSLLGDLDINGIFIFRWLNKKEDGSMDLTRVD
jgi:hypothetical protein